MFELTSHTSSRTAGRPLLHAVGDLDIFDAQVVRNALHEHADGEVAVMRLDLSDVTWVNASALGHLARTRAHLTARLGVRLDLLDWSAAVRRMSERAGLCGVLGGAA